LGTRDFQNLTTHGYDVFVDYNGIVSGDFERVILGNITARAHFLVSLTPSALERCEEPADWLRCEIEAALANQRNVAPLMPEGFDFGAPRIASQLTEEQNVAARAAPAVQEEELIAQQWFEGGFTAIDVDEQLRFYSEAIRLKPDHASAF
jgi:hypothetical protein